MAIISYDKDTPIDYIPEYGGNRDSENPCVVRLRFVPCSKVQEYSRHIAARNKGVSDADTDKRVSISQEVQKKQFTESVESVSGYFVGEREVTGAAEFYESAPYELVYELIAAMQDLQRLTAGQRKN